MGTSSLLLLGLSATVALACIERETKPPCKDDSIKGVFILADGTGTFKKEAWAQVRPFVDMFESLISSRKPVWLMQFSSEKEWCSPAPGTSWECAGSQDHCKTHQPWKQLDSCPTTHKSFLSPGWNQTDFQHAAEEVFGKFQNGWTHPWHFINECAEMWMEYKKQHGLKEKDRALFILMSDGEEQPYDIEKNKAKAIQNFKDANMRFLFVFNNKFAQFNYNTYKDILDVEHDVVEIPKTSGALNQELADRVVMTGCETH